MDDGRRGTLRPCPWPSAEHERQDFLAGVHVGVISIERSDGSPLSVPIWYGYEPGRLVWIITGAVSLKARMLKAARRFSLCAQTEEPPFCKYVSVEGPVVDVAPADLEADRRSLAHRYFAIVLGDATWPTPTRKPAVPKLWFSHRAFVKGIMPPWNG